MNWTSSNLLRRRQFSARNILRSISIYAYKQYRDAYHPAPLSPSPWATMTVAVCRLRAGTIKGLAMVMSSCPIGGGGRGWSSGMVRTWGNLSGEMTDFRYAGPRPAALALFLH